MPAAQSATTSGQGEGGSPPASLVRASLGLASSGVEESRLSTSMLSVSWTRGEEEAEAGRERRALAARLRVPGPASLAGRPASIGERQA